MVDKIIYTFWFGDTMSKDRYRCYKSIIKNSKVKVILINEENLSDYCKNLHPGFQYLSATHKSDYLRSYFMYNYGGGYTDIKFCNSNWNIYFDKLNSCQYQFIGYHEISKNDICVPSLKSHFLEIAGPTQFIFKSHTPFAKDWYDQTQHKMNQIFDILKENPGLYHPRAEFGGVQGEKGNFKNSKYPLAWNDLLGKIFHQLSYDYRGAFCTDMQYPNIQEKYR